VNGGTTPSESLMAAIVVLDAGTGGGKCVVFDEHGKRLGEHREAWTYEVRENPDFPVVKQFSFDPDEFWAILCRCVRLALEKAAIDGGDVIGVSCTSQREGCVFLDSAGDEIYAGPNLDARGFNEGIEVLGQLGERLYEITGHSAPFIFPLARYLWFRKHGAGNVAKILMLNDWITYRLTGEICSEPSNATESMMFDLRRRCWSEEILAAFDISIDVMPALLRCGERVSGVIPEAAAATGLREGTPVFVGGADTQCSLLGAGAIEPHVTGATLGTTTPVQRVVSEPVFDPASLLWVGCHVVPNRWVLESNAGDTGDAYLWLLDLLSGGLPRDQLYAFGETLAREREPSPTMMFIGPSIFNLTKLNMNRPGGILFPFPAMHVRPDRAAIVQGFLENLAFALRGNLEQIAAVTGRSSPELALSGGMSRSDAAIQKIADVVGVPVRVALEPESAALGCAVLVAACLEGASLETVEARMVRHRGVDPHRERHERYDAVYRKWRVLNDRFDDLSI
jgi:autoinducer 2 (AI-2) kinase